jgi:glyoxylase-like metal-dependent hydrolase (beta-lactamase superfamily II)/rhodanese-related sulfurtransferase
MYFEQFYLACLSHASYMIGSDGVAAVVDPQRDVGLYLDEAEKNGFRIQAIIETHLHADFVSGHRELAERTGAQIYLGAKAGAKFPHVPVTDGMEIALGTCRLRFLETPGHTLESICILVTDLERSRDPFAVLTGDTLFIGDVGRPDLSGDLSAQTLAGMLYDSIHGKLLALGDDVLVYPAHGAGSLCGRQMSSETRSTIGREKLSNYALRAKDQQSFVDLVTAELPERPGYFAADVELNRAGAPALENLQPLPRLSAGELAARQQAGDLVLDTRPPAEFGAAHIPGALNIALSGQYALWAGTLLGLDRDIVIVAEEGEKVDESRLRLARVGIERVRGYLDGGISAWIGAGMAVDHVPQISVEELDRQLAAGPGEIELIDVRRPSEWDAGHIERAVLKPLHKLTGLLGGVKRDRLIAVYCRSGYRSSIATSLLRAAGFRQVINVTGGFDAWRVSGLPFATGTPGALEPQPQTGSARAAAATSSEKGE